MWVARDRLMRQLLYSLSEEDIIKRDCNIYKTKHFLVMKKKIHMLKYTFSLHS